MELETIAFLLRIRQDMQRGRLLMYIGEKRIERLASFVEGYREGLRANGSKDEEYGRFTQWSRDAGRELSGLSWPAEYLRDSQGKQEQAIHMYLEHVSQFSGLYGYQGPSKPETAKQQRDCVGTTEVLLRLRDEMKRGRLPVLLAETNADYFETFVEGCHSCLLANGCADDAYGRFFEWLRDTKQEMPGEGWPAKYLRDCRGNHPQAIRRYLDFVAEFAALEENRRPI